ncbi:hypothetical protein JYQ62_21725 [Nostoc sp. UHCC 0702]|nr:hypothetical protein JYQ62_21725 [Nostoc sp. UHCC 0702]
MLECLLISVDSTVILVDFASKQVETAVKLQTVAAIPELQLDENIVGRVGTPRSLQGRGEPVRQITCHYERSDSGVK